MNEHVEKIVDAVCEALGVDAGTIHESKFEEANNAVRKVLAKIEETSLRMQQLECSERNLENAVNQARAERDILQDTIIKAMNR